MFNKGVFPGDAIYEGGKKPVRDESVQADYISDNIKLLSEAGANGVFMYVFSYPIYPYDENLDMDMISYALVKSFPSADSRSHLVLIVSWLSLALLCRIAPTTARNVSAYGHMQDLIKR